jgi:hypothetical protein
MALQRFSAGGAEFTQAIISLYENKTLKNLGGNTLENCLPYNSLQPSWFVSKRIRILAASAREAFPDGSSIPLPLPVRI